MSTNGEHGKLELRNSDADRSLRVAPCWWQQYDAKQDTRDNRVVIVQRSTGCKCFLAKQADTLGLETGNCVLAAKHDVGSLTSSPVATTIILRVKSITAIGIEHFP